MTDSRKRSDEYELRQVEALEKMARALVSIDERLNIIVVKLDWLAKIQGSPRPR